MNKHHLHFVLDDNIKIVIELKEPLDKVHCCYFALFALENNGQRLVVADDTVRYNLQKFYGMLTKSLNNQLRLDPSINKNIGFLYNQYQRYTNDDKPRLPSSFVSRDPKYRNDWVGFTYLLFGHCGFIVWLYNTVNGDIVFEVTLRWRGFFDKKSRRKKVMPYAQWMAQYKPYLITTIPRDVAQQWLKQTEFILKTIEENIKRFEAEAKAAETATKSSDKKIRLKQLS